MSWFTAIGDKKKAISQNENGEIKTESKVIGEVSTTSKIVDTDIQKLLLKNVADDLPFAKNVMNYETPNNPIIVPGGSTEWDAPTVGLHAPRVYFDSNWPETWRTYYMGADSNGVAAVGFASATDPTGTWIKSVNNPILTATEPFENATYGVNGLSIAHVKGVGFVGFYGYKNSDGLITTGKAISTDGIVWTGKVPCVFDDELAPYTSVAQITGVMWESDKQRYVACMHVGSSLIPLMGAVVESTDGINWKTLAILNGGISNADSQFGEPFDAFGITKTGSTYVVFGHKWHKLDYGSGDRDYKIGHYAVSTDLDNWWISEKPMGMPQSDRDVGRYGYWTLGHDAWWGVHTTSYPLEVALIRLPITEPSYTYILNGATITNGGSDPVNRWLSPESKTRKISITARARYGATTGEIKVRIRPLMIPSALQYWGNAGAPSIEFPLPVTTAENLTSLFATLDDIPDKFAIDIVNNSGSTITEVDLRLSFRD